MDISTISGAAMIMQTAQTQQSMSISMIKMVANQQAQVADLLAQGVQSAQQISAESAYSFSTSA